MSLQEQEHSLNLGSILSEEITLYKHYERRTREELEKIFLSAAKKLEKVIEDKGEISAVLSKQWPKDARRIREYLPNEYKRGYRAKKEDNFPQDEVDEFLQTVVSVFDDGSEVFKAIQRKYHESTGVLRVDFRKQLIKIFEGEDSAPLSVQLDQWKKWGIEMSHSKQETDERTKLNQFYKVMVRVQALYGTKSDVAKKARLSPKWYKNGIESDPTIQENFNKMVLWLFPQSKATAEELSEWFNHCLLLDKTDPDAKKPLPPGHKGEVFPDDED